MGFLHRSIDMRLEFHEILAEHVDEFLRGFGEFGFRGPGLDRIEQMRLDAGHRFRHGEAEIGIGALFVVVLVG